MSSTQATDLVDLVSDLFDDAEREAQDVTDHLDSVHDALRELDATADVAREKLDEAYALREDGEIDEDDFDAIEGYVGDILDKLSDARQEIRNVGA
jgi:hypothetical protein